jgi:AcrR family transcriptional regulator
MTLTKKNLKIEQGQATTQNLVTVARQLFSQRGYAAVSTEEVVRTAQVTRGALYHHFAGKRELFLAVFEEAQREIAARIEQAALAAPDAWAGLLAGCRAFLEVSLDPGLQRLVMLDAPAVLGWEMWRQVDAVHGLSSLKAGLKELIEAGLIKSQPLDALAHLLSGAMNEAALWIAQSPDPPQALQEAMATLEVLLEGVRTR